MLNPYPCGIKPKLSSFQYLAFLYEALIDKLDSQLDIWSSLRQLPVRQQKIAKDICLRNFMSFALQQLKEDMSTGFLYTEDLPVANQAEIMHQPKLTIVIDKVQNICFDLHKQISIFLTDYQFILPIEHQFFYNLQIILTQTIQTLFSYSLGNTTMFDQ